MAETFSAEDKRRAAAREVAQPRIDRVGERFGSRVVIRLNGRGAGGNALWLCVCDCGAESTAKVADLKTSGCPECARAAKILHGHNGRARRSRTYHTWVAMKNRCTNPQQDNFSRYGGRGIKVCSRWDNFDLFLADMGERPTGKTLDREDNDKDYDPDNCRWATQAEQRANQRGPKP